MKKLFILSLVIFSFVGGCIIGAKANQEQQQDKNIYKYVYNGTEEAQPGTKDRLIIDFIDEETKTYYILTE